VARGHCRKPSVANGQQPFGRSHPQGSVARLAQNVDPVVPERRAVACVEDRESDAVESHQSFLCPEPQVAVQCLGNRIDGVLRHPGVGVPYVMSVLRKWGAGIQPAQSHRDQKERPEAEAPPTTYCHPARSNQTGSLLPLGTNERLESLDSGLIRDERLVFEDEWPIPGACSTHRQGGNGGSSEWKKGEGSQRLTEFILRLR